MNILKCLDDDKKYWFKCDECYEKLQTVITIHFGDIYLCEECLRYGITLIEEV